MGNNSNCVNPLMKLQSKIDNNRSTAAVIAVHDRNNSNSIRLYNLYFDPTHLHPDSLYFTSLADTEKVRNIMANNQVSLAVLVEFDNYVKEVFMEGTASVIKRGKLAYIQVKPYRITVTKFPKAVGQGEIVDVQRYEYRLNNGTWSLRECTESSYY